MCIGFNSNTLTQTFSLDYHRSSSVPLEAKHPFPAALLDAIAGYRYVSSLDFEQENVMIAGNSTGGNLVLAYGYDNHQH